MKTKDAWMVEVNSDLNEGRGRSAICEVQATAYRMARGANTQGSDGKVTTVEIRFDELNGPLYWTGPVNIVTPTKEDIAAQETLDKKRDAIKRALDLGLTAEDIAAISGGR